MQVVMPAFDFAFGLGGGGITQRDTMEMQGRANVGKGIWRVVEEQKVKIHMKCKWPAAGLEEGVTKVSVNCCQKAG